MKKITLLFLAVFAFSLFANAQDPVLRYTFDDVITNSGTVGAAGDLTVQETPTEVPGTAAYATGIYNNGYSGDGLNSLASSYAGITGHAARTITGWVKLPDIDNKAMIVELGRRTSGTNGERFSVLFASANGNITLACGGNQKITSHPSTLVADTWTFFAVTHDGTDFVTGTTLIVDNGSGDVSETGTDTSFAIDTQYDTPSLSTKILLGTLNGVINETAVAVVDDIRIYDYALSLPQIATVKSGASLGVNDVAFGADELKAYPTLVTDVLNLETSVNERLTVNVFSVLGNRVHRSIGNKVDMSSLSSGLYIVKVRAGNKVSNIKVLKK